jgi:hypothetical protein
MDEIRNEIHIEAAGSASFELEGFASVFARYLEEAEQVYDLNVEVLSCRGPRGKRLEILGYAEDITDQSLTILAGRYFGEDATLTLTEAKEVFSRASGFVELSFGGTLSASLEPSSREAEYSAYFHDQYAKNKFAKVRVLLITDGFMSDRIKNLESGAIAGVKVVYEIWDQKRMLDSASPEKRSEDILVDFTEWMPDGLPCLVAETEDSATETYLAVIPAGVLAAIFEEFGSLLLESNVRTFLSARGAVNKGIQATLAQEPHRFLAYNNGLTTTAADVVIDRTGAGTAIKSIAKWQIVNGGQTTASIVHYLRGDKSRSIADVNVQMKLVKVRDDDASSVVQAVAKYANSQNRVSGADLFATHEFHVRLEQISRRLRAPAKEGAQYQTGWYYERARGQWEYEKASRSGTAERNRFDLEYPRAQKITKTDWAKYSYCWGKKPHLVSKGAQSVFADYAVAVDKQWETSDDEFNENYFKNNVGKAIIYEGLRTAVMKEDWYKSSPGYLANIVAYAIAKFRLQIDDQFPAQKYDFTKTWNLQAIPLETLRALLAIAHEAQVYLNDPRRPQANVTQWAKQTACWEGFSKVSIAVDSAVAEDLLDANESAVLQREATKVRKMDSGFEAINRVLEVMPETWKSVAMSVSKHPISPMEADLVEAFGAGNKKVPSERQAKALIRMLDRFSSIGVIGRDDY